MSVVSYGDPEGLPLSFELVCHLLNMNPLKVSICGHLKAHVFYGDMAPLMSLTRGSEKERARLPGS